MRVGLVCPYSLSLPGGVQGQVLGLARELRRQGHEARVLGPCDGPPPEAFVTPLGNSLPTAANGSIAPLAPDPPAALRTIRVLNDERFDVVHVHEPLAPGPPMTTVMMHPAPLVGTFHAAGRSSSYVVFRPIVRWMAARIDRKVVVSKDALELAQSHLGGEYSVLFNGVEVDEIAGTAPTPTTNPTIFFLGRHEERKGLAVLLRAFRSLPDDVRLWIGGDGPDAPQLRAESPRRRAHLVARPDQRRREVRPPAGRFGALRAVVARRVVRRRADRGDGGGHPRRGQRASTATATSPPTGVDALLVPPGDADALATALGKVLADETLAAALGAAGRRRAEEFSMRTLAAEYAGIYRQLVERARPEPRRSRPAREPYTHEP